MPARTYAGLWEGKAGVLFAGESSEDSQLRIHRYDMRRGTAVVLENVSDFDVSFNGEKLFYRQQGVWAVIPDGGAAAKKRPTLKRPTDPGSQPKD